MSIERPMAPRRGTRGRGIISEETRWRGNDGARRGTRGDEAEP